MFDPVTLIGKQWENDGFNYYPIYPVENDIQSDTGIISAFEVTSVYEDETGERAIGISFFPDWVNSTKQKEVFLDWSDFLMLVTDEDTIPKQFYDKYEDERTRGYY
jgi:hypothetical protein